MDQFCPHGWKLYVHRGSLYIANWSIFDTEKIKAKSIDCKEFHGMEGNLVDKHSYPRTGQWARLVIQGRMKYSHRE